MSFVPVFTNLHFNWKGKNPAVPLVGLFSSINHVNEYEFYYLGSL